MKGNNNKAPVYNSFPTFKQYFFQPFWFWFRWQTLWHCCTFFLDFNSLWFYTRECGENHSITKWLYIHCQYGIWTKMAGLWHLILLLLFCLAYSIQALRDKVPCLETDKFYRNPNRYYTYLPSTVYVTYNHLEF